MAPEQPLSLRVVLVGDDPLARGGLHAAISGDGVEVVSHASLAEAPALVESGTVDAVLWDLGPDGRGASALSALRNPAPLLALAPDSRAAAQALASGATGVMARDADRRRLRGALSAVAAGIVAIDDNFVQAVLPRASKPEPPTESLTARELEVLQLLAQGMANKTIATQLHISEHTAKFHVNAILAKLGVDSRTEAVVRAARLGLVVF